MLKTYFLIIISTALCLACTSSPSDNNGENDSSAQQLDVDSSSENPDSDSNGSDDTDSSSDSGTIQPDTSCDGENVDCYTECWQCGYENECQDEVNACKADTGCDAYLSCKESQCCPGGTCLTGADWEECMNNCQSTHNIFELSIYLYEKLNQCVTCEACSVSCFQNQPQESIPSDLCTPEYSFTVPPCWPEQTLENETSCFTWAGWGGPCTAQQEACHTNDTCNILEECILDSYHNDGPWEFIQAECFKAAGPEVETMYWAYLQCIECDACAFACPHASFGNDCNKYVPQQ